MSYFDTVPYVGFVECVNETVSSLFVEAVKSDRIFLWIVMARCGITEMVK